MNDMLLIANIISIVGNALCIVTFIVLCVISVRNSKPKKISLDDMKKETAIKVLQELKALHTDNEKFTATIDYVTEHLNKGE